MMTPGSRRTMLAPGSTVGNRCAAETGSQCERSRGEICSVLPKQSFGHAEFEIHPSSSIQRLRATGRLIHTRTRQ
jgi:allantoicase